MTLHMQELGMYDSQLLWDRFESVLVKRAPTLLSTLFAPASIDEIENTEAELKLKFPRDLRVAYLRHNGSSGDPQLPGFFVGHIAEWLSLSEMKAYWRIARDISLEAWPENCDSPADAEMNQGKVRRDVWNAGRIPVGRVHGNDHFFVDLLPGATGTVGQLVRDADMWGECTDESVVATSFDAYLTLFADRLEQGLIAYVPGKSWVNKEGKTFSDWRNLSGW
jgi:cell wall assembly regulator SMI1